MKILFITGDAAVGKMTVGQEVARLTNMVLMHNHITIEPILEMFGTLDKKLLIESRDWWYEKLSKMQLTGVIFTFMINYDHLIKELSYLDHILSYFDKPDVYYVELIASIETRLKRNATENRLYYKPSKEDIKLSNSRLLNDDKAGRFESKDGEVPFSNFLRIENEELTPEQQAIMIINKFNL